MKIISRPTSNPEIEIIEMVGELTGTAAIELQEWLNTCLDKGKCFQVINLGRMTEIDGFGINILESFVKRGMQIRLFNVESKIRWIFKISGKEDVFKIYNESECDRAVSMLEKELIGKKAQS